MTDKDIDSGRVHPATPLTTPVLTDLQKTTAQALKLGDVDTIHQDQYGLLVTFRHSTATFKWHANVSEWRELI